MHLLECLVQKVEENNFTLSPHARFVWLLLLRMASERGESSVTNTVNELCSTAGICDKTLKKSIDELRSLGLVKRQRHMTDMGARSYQYRAICDKACFASIDSETKQLERDALFNKSAMRASKPTVQQRLLLIAALIVWVEYRCISMFYKSTLARLTGLSIRSVGTGVAKLINGGDLSPIQIGTLQHGRRAEADVLRPTGITVIGGTKLLFSNSGSSTIDYVRVNCNKTELAEGLKSIKFTELRKRVPGYEPLTWRHIEAEIKPIASHLSEDIQNNLTKLTRNACAVLSKVIKNHGQRLDLLLTINAFVLLKNSLTTNSGPTSRWGTMLSEQDSCFALSHWFHVKGETIREIAQFVNILAIDRASQLFESVSSVVQLDKHPAISVEIESFKPITFGCQFEGYNDRSKPQTLIFNFT